MGKIKVNSWLIDRDFLGRAKVSNYFYFETLCKYVYDFLKDAPIPIVCSFDPKNERLYFMIGANGKFWIEIDVDVSYLDYITLLRRELLKFYPSYKVEFEDEISLSDEELLIEIHEKGLTVDDALLLKKKVTIKEKGLIEDIYLSKDEFVFIQNSKKTIRLSGDIYNLLPLREFLKTIRHIDDDEEKRKYILKNSHEKKLADKEEDVYINYIDNQMKNFFVINFMDLKYISLQKVEDSVYRWGKYIISFKNTNNLILEKECLAYVDQQRYEKGIVIDEVLNKK